MCIANRTNRKIFRFLCTSLPWTSAWMRSRANSISIHKWTLFHQMQVCILYGFNSQLSLHRFTCSQIHRLAPCLFSQTFLFVHIRWCWNYNDVLIFLRYTLCPTNVKSLFLLCLRWSVCQCQCQLLFHTCMSGRGMVWVEMRKFEICVYFLLLIIWCLYYSKNSWIWIYYFWTWNIFFILIQVLLWKIWRSLINFLFYIKKNVSDNIITF